LKSRERRISEDRVYQLKVWRCGRIGGYLYSVTVNTVTEFFGTSLIARQLRNLDHYFTEGATGQMLERLVRLVEGIGLIDHRAYCVFVQEFVHAIKR